MSYDDSVSAHYLHGNLLKDIELALDTVGKTKETVTIEDLAPVDEFHVGGRLATDHLLKQLHFPTPSSLLDVGCGLGGAARYIAEKYSHNVTGIDLTAEYIKTGNALSCWLNLDDKVCLNQGSALSMPYEEHSFDGGYMLHVGMNIADKLSLFVEVYRVLKPGATFAVYDLMRQKAGELLYPVPWAKNSNISQLSTVEQYTCRLEQAGFDILVVNNRRDFAVEFFKKLSVKSVAKHGKTPLGLHILMQESAGKKIENMVENITHNYIAPVEIIARKI